MAGPERLSPGLPVKEPSPLPSFGLVPCEGGVSISFSSTKTFSYAPLITIGVSSMTPTSNCSCRQDELVVGGVVTTDRDREIEIQSLFESAEQVVVRIVGCESDDRSGPIA